MKDVGCPIVEECENDCELGSEERKQCWTNYLMREEESERTVIDQTEVR